MKVDIVPFAEQICQHNLNLHHVIVRQHNEEVASFDFFGDTRQCNIHSATKSVTSLAVGIAIGEGLLSLDDRPVDVLKDHLPEKYDHAWDAVTLRDMLTMASGHLETLLPGYTMDPSRITRDQLDNSDWVNYAFSRPLDTKPGTIFTYNNACPIMAVYMIAKRAGEPLLKWLRPRLFEPLGIRNPQWLTAMDGEVCGAGGLVITPEQFSLLTQLCLNRGEWKGRRLVPAEYIDDASRSHIVPGFKGEVKPASCANVKPSALTGYGYFFWVFEGDGAYSFNGWGGQLGIVLPKLDATVVLTGRELYRGAELTDLVWTHLLPGVRENA